MCRTIKSLHLIGNISTIGIHRTTAHLTNQHVNRKTEHQPSGTNKEFTAIAKEIRSD
jgi:hypothetical protein